MEKYGYRYDWIDDSHAVHITDSSGKNMFLLIGRDRGLLVDTGTGLLMSWYDNENLLTFIRPFI